MLGGPSTSIALVAVAVVLATILLRPKVANAPLWRAVVTPLASIIGSGFLVAGPILSSAAGHLAFAAMLLLCLVGYMFGAAIRFNIGAVEPLLRESTSRRVVLVERASELVLAFAYFISVAYYLNLFAAFGLRAFGITSPTAIRLATSVVLAALGIAGLAGGLRAFERIETAAVGLKLAVIGGLLAALVLATVPALAGGTLTWPEIPHPRGWHEVQVVLGLVILVQGFETSRYLGSEHDADTRIRTMRWAQWLSTAIYVVFLALAAPFFTGGLLSEGGETAIIDLLAPLGSAVAPSIILAALASQLSAAVADLNGAGGLLSEVPASWLTERVGYVVTVCVALLITWSANIYEIVAYASKAFVVYYGLQSFQASALALGRGQHLRSIVFGIGVVLAVGIVILAAPASA